MARDTPVTATIAMVCEGAGKIVGCTTEWGSFLQTLGCHMIQGTFSTASTYSYNRCCMKFLGLPDGFAGMYYLL